MDALGVRLGRILKTGAVVYLTGELGAGKTTLVRGVLHGLGYEGRVRSPTYTLMEGYEIQERLFQHLDLYRVRDPGELEYLGIRDLDDPDAWVFVEWPELGAHQLPPADLELRLEFLDAGRRVHVQSGGDRGRMLAEAWKSGVGAAGTPGLHILD